MSRPLRIEFPGAVYHLTSRGNTRGRLYIDDDDKWGFIDLLGYLACKRRWDVYAYCLMDNHYHILAETQEPNLSASMRDLNGIYVRRFNTLHKKTGHLFEGRFKAVIIDKESHLLAAARYIVLNPVRANIVKDPADWPFSSYRETAGDAAVKTLSNTDVLLSSFSSDPTRARALYRQFVLSGVNERIWEEPGSETLLGREPLATVLQPKLSESRNITEIPRRQRYASRPPLKSLFDVKCCKAERDGRICAAHLDHGYTQTEIGAFLGLHYSTVSRIITRNVG